MNHTEIATWDAIALTLVGHNVEIVFGLPDDDMRQLHSFEAAGIRVVLSNDQRNAVYQAIGYARASHRLAVVMLGRGPALSHAATGLLEADQSRVPLLVLSTSVALTKSGTRAFQEVDSLSMLAPYTRWRRRVPSARTTQRDVQDAIFASISGTPGVSHLDIPDDVAEERCPWGEQKSTPAPTDVCARRMLEKLSESRAPLMLVGGGCSRPGAGPVLEDLAFLLGAAIICTASGRGVIDEENPNFLGVSGLYGYDPTIAVVNEADLILVFGSQLEESATVGWEIHETDLVQVNLVMSDISPHFTGFAVCGDVQATCESWSAYLSRQTNLSSKCKWLSRVSSWRSQLDNLRHDVELADPGGRPRVHSVLAALDRVLPYDRLSVHENGLHDIQSYFFPDWIVRAPASCIVPSEQTPLGFGLASAIGAALASPGRAVVAIGGDGALRAVATELDSWARLDVPLLMVILTNGGFGWLQAKYESSRLSVCGERRFLQEIRPIGALCAAYGIHHIRCSRQDRLSTDIQKAWELCSDRRVTVFEVEIDFNDRHVMLEHLLEH